jgi:hypothetical protein
MKSVVAWIFTCATAFTLIGMPCSVYTWGMLISSVIILSERRSYDSQPGQMKVPPPWTIRKPSARPSSSSTFLPISLRRPNTMSASSGPAFL